MQRILRRRILRDLKENRIRYLSLGLLIFLCMFLVVALIGAAETVICGVEEHARQNKIEDGEFSVFVPLKENESKKLESLGITLQQQFYLDYSAEGDTTLRVFKNREQMNLMELEQGKVAEAEEEIVLEKRYCEEHKLSCGDRIAIDGHTYQITGIATVPDYDAPYKTFSDSTVDSRQFGLAFVTGKAYEALKQEKKSEKSEQYVYAYRTNGKCSDQQLKRRLEKLTCVKDDVEDKYFLEYWTENVGNKEELQDNISKLAKGTRDLSEGLQKLENHNGSLTKAADELFSSYLEKAQEALSEYGLTKTLTEDNYERVLDDLMDSSEQALFKLKLTSVKNQLKELKQFKDGVREYTGGVSDASKGSEKVDEGMAELKKQSDEMIHKLFKTDMNNLVQFIKAEDNKRIRASAEDQQINRACGLIAGIILMILFTYVISVFVIHGIEKENRVIGALYALGGKKKDLLLHYLALPVCVTLIFGILGTAAGFTRFGIDILIQSTYEYYSVPVLENVHPVYLLVYGLMMPPVAAAFVNYLVIVKKLNQPALRMIRNEQKQSRISHINLGTMGFVNRFQIRQMLRELRTSFTVVFGMFISLLVLMLALDCYTMCVHINKESRENTKYEYMYTYKYPEASVPKGGTEAYAKTLKKEAWGQPLEVTILGIRNDNPYFHAEVEEGKSRVAISSAVAGKYGVSQGDQMILTDEEDDREYAFTVTSVTDYSTGMYVFMDIDSMRELFGVGEDYYNVVFSDKELKIPSGRLYSVSTRNDVEKSSNIFLTMMYPMVIMLTGVSALIFAVVMYLMMKVMIDRSAFHIALIKIFGYRMNEIRKLYLNGNFFTIAVGGILCIPLAKVCMDAIYPMLVSNVAIGINLTFGWQVYAIIYLGMIALYFIINAVLTRRIRSFVPAEVLKNRE